jgi:hypothetical protein
MTEPPKFPREPPELGGPEAEEQLFAELHANAEQYATDTDFGRRAAREAILSVLSFLLDRGLSGQAAKIFGDLAQALMDVEQGTLPEMFNPNSATHAGADGRQVWTRSTKGQETDLYLAATAMALRRRRKKKLSEIFEKVARHAQNWPRISSGIITSGRVKDAYNIYRSAPKQGETTTEFERIVESLSEGPNAAQYLEDVLANGPPLTGGTKKQKI